MVRKGVLILSVFLGSFLFSGRVAFAQEVVNAGLVGSIWYGDRELIENKETSIHSAFYNQTNTEITGTAVFRIGESELARTSWVAREDTLVPLEAVWKPTSGKHTITVSIVESTAPVEMSTVSTTVSVKKAPIVVPEITVQNATNTVKTIVETIKERGDAYADTLAEQLQAQKIQNTNTSSVQVQKTTDQKQEDGTNTSREADGEVLGAQDSTEDAGEINSVLGISTENLSPETKTKIVRAHNAGIDGITWIVRNWQWAALALVLLLIIFLRRRKKEY